MLKYQHQSQAPYRREPRSPSGLVATAPRDWDLLFENGVTRPSDSVVKRPGGPVVKGPSRPVVKGPSGPVVKEPRSAGVKEAKGRTEKFSEAGRELNLD